VIRSFRDAESEALSQGVHSRQFQGIARVAQRKLAQLNAAAKLEDLRVFPGNRLEVLAGDRKGQHSVRINDQYRICFVWKDGDAHQVEVVDYH